MWIWSVANAARNMHLCLYTMIFQISGWKKYFYSSIHSFIFPYLIIYSFIHLFISLFIYSFIHLFLSLCIYSFIHLFIHSSFHIFINPTFINLNFFSHIFIHLFIHSYLYTYTIYQFRPSASHPLYSFQYF